MEVFWLIFNLFFGILNLKWAHDQGSYAWLHLPIGIFQILCAGLWFSRII